MDPQLIMAWSIFLTVVLAMLAMDLLLFHRKPRELGVREALWGSALPVMLALGFVGCIYWAYATHSFHLGVLPAGVQGTSLERFYPTTGRDAAVLFLTGYLVELSLSADNVFLFVLLMGFFHVPRHLQHRVLFWGVMGALVMRGAMILGGAALLSHFHWLIYVFGAFLLITGIRMMFSGHKESDPSGNFALRWVKKILPVKDGFDGKRFFTRTDGRWAATTLFLVLVCIEFTDLVFALDSIPAIFGITRDAFIVFTSNIFAILGLRSMYFLLEGVMDKFRFLKLGLAVVLAFVGIKMVLPGLGLLYGHWTGEAGVDWELNQYVSLAVIVGVLAVAILASLLGGKQAPGGDETRTTVKTAG